eukprot:15035298-Ditylum_brightwellii.AAC.1
MSNATTNQPGSKHQRLNVYRASDDHNHQQESQQAEYDPITTTSFQEYIKNQPNHVRQLLGTLQA